MKARRRWRRATGCWRILTSIMGKGSETGRPFLLQHLLLQPGGGAIGRALLEGDLSADCRDAGESAGAGRLLPGGCGHGGGGGGRGGNNEAAYGQDYSTAMAVLSLTPAYQLLPVYQR